MKKAAIDRDLLPEYDFRNGVRGKNAKRYASGTNIVLIDADVRKYFPDQKSVNEALRSLVPILRRQRKAMKDAAHGRG